MYLFLQHVTFWLRACHLFSFSSCDAQSWTLSLSAAWLSWSADHVFKKLYSPIKWLRFVYFPWFCQHIYIFQMVLEVNSAISKCCVGQHTLHHCKLWLCFLNCSYLNWRRCSPSLHDIENAGVFPYNFQYIFSVSCKLFLWVWTILCCTTRVCNDGSAAVVFLMAMVKAGERFVDQTNTCAFRRTH